MMGDSQEVHRCLDKEEEQYLFRTGEEEWNDNT